MLFPLFIFLLFLFPFSLVSSFIKKIEWDSKRVSTKSRRERPKWNEIESRVHSTREFPSPLEWNFYAKRGCKRGCGHLSSTDIERMTTQRDSICFSCEFGLLLSFCVLHFLSFKKLKETCQRKETNERRKSVPNRLTFLFCFAILKIFPSSFTTSLLVLWLQKRRHRMEREWGDNDVLLSKDTQEAAFTQRRQRMIVVPTKRRQKQEKKRSISFTEKSKDLMLPLSVCSTLRKEIRERFVTSSIESVSSKWHK